MKLYVKQLLVGAAAVGLCFKADAASDLTLHLSGNAAFSKKVMQYTCDAKGKTIGLPVGTFSVEYINGGGNSLAIVPVNGSSLIFVNVDSGSGARYAASQYVWWEAGGGVNFSSDTLAGQVQSVCKRSTSAKP